MSTVVAHSKRTNREEMMKKEPIFLIVVTAFIVMPILNSRAEADFRTIDTARLHRMVVDNAYRLEAGRERDFTVIDARLKEKYDAAHVASAISIPEKDLEKSFALLGDDKGRLLVVYGNGGKMERSRRWADRAAAAGYSNIVIYSEGFTAWKEKKMPVARLRNGM
jgi:rhodanese-related sulfurtransferase